jgi:hypothetical protein
MTIKTLDKVAVKRWRRDPVSFVREVLVNPEDGQPFELYPEQVEFLRRAFTLTPAGRLPFPDILYGAPKKSGKTALGAMCGLYVVVATGGPYGEVYCLANDYEQAASRVFSGSRTYGRSLTALASRCQGHGQSDRIQIDWFVHAGVRIGLHGVCRQQPVPDHL